MVGGVAEPTGARMGTLPGYPLRYVESRGSQSTWLYAVPTGAALEVDAVRPQFPPEPPAAAPAAFGPPTLEEN